MPYTAEISRRNPSAILFVIDQSGSMNDRWGKQNTTKSQGLADILNRLIAEIILKSSKEDGVRHYFDIGVIAYAGERWRDGLSFISGPILKPLPQLSDHPLRVETRTQKIPDGAGGVITQEVKFPVWFEAVADGGTPMREALQAAAEAIADWADAHPSAFPPTVIHITDGEPTTGDPEPVATAIQHLQTDDGNILLFNLHIGSAAGEVIFPSSESEIPSDPAARLLFRMSSPLPDFIIQAGQDRGYRLAQGARGYGYNVSMTETVDFLVIGTQAVNLAR